jgi:CreA protein
VLPPKNADPFAASTCCGDPQVARRHAAALAGWASGTRTATFAIAVTLARSWFRNVDMKKFITVLAVLSMTSTGARAERIGEVDTVFKFIGPDHKIVVDAYDDPKVAGITCFVSRAKTGGIKGGLGLAEDKSEASIACRQTGPVSFIKPLPKQEEVFDVSLSLLFKKLRVVRIVDAKRNTLVYLTYSERVIEGSPQNSVTAVPVDRGTPIPLK